jgi:signal transduction histidine kinase
MTNNANDGNDRTTRPYHAEPEAKAQQNTHLAPRWQRFRTLRLKTLLIVAVTLMALLVLLYIPLRVFMLGSFAALEDQMVRIDLQRAQSALAGDIHQIDIFNTSFAIWDDSYAFVADHNEDYIEKNYYDQFFIDNRLNLVLVTDTAGNVIFGKGFDLSTQSEQPVPQRFLRIKSRDPLIDGLTETNSITGIVSLPYASMLVASHAIVTSEGHGPIRGALLMGRYLDAQETQYLAESIHLTLAIHRRDDPGTPADISLARAQLSDRPAPLVLPLSEEQIAGYVPVDDLDASDRLLLRITAARSVYAQGQAGMRYLMVSLLIAGLTFGGLILALLERVILSRLAYLNTSVRRIGASGDLAARVAITGHDELAQLADAVNSMLAALERAQANQRLAEEVREQVRIQAEALRAKREFLSIVSHELRTPITPIMGFVDLLLLGEGGELTDEHHYLLQSIKSNTLRLTRLVDDLLEIGRIETNKVQLHFAPTDLRAMLTEVGRLLEPERVRKAMTLTYQIADGMPLVEADSKRIEQVLINLLSNAIKYTYPHGQITIRAFQQSDKYIEVHVEDTGVGISPEQQQRLFVPFYRADNPLRDKVRGSGLGLSIARSFVELHGGTMWVQSNVGVGSVFAFTLPIKQQRPAYAIDAVSS